MTQPASVIDLYDSLLAAEDERARARIIAGAFERLEDRYPELKDLATASGVRESELRLQKEIEQVRADLSKEIEKVRTELIREIEKLRADTSKEIAFGNQKILRWTTGLLFAQLAAIIAVIFGVGLM
ncbi:conserved hypothetical protein [Desulfonatronospira thiodismutans ASO3-1]|uniref:DUF1640 domain-containing protein n=1 Tax=Desulfonatronospira thiodismutans ASO3-1 TaxID=555779 RepID=D6STX2_9BACT|nr:hypothetical protein [Desulfonatronospira thiodismutans]EFI34138.1 conserved hypothetical protein [Desulfonatronospira thiodismutans ASO3-1]